MSRHNVNFPTGSTFYGNYNELGMHDFGLYTYPDGTKYLGQFYKNRFHGKGTIELPCPHSVCFNVLHDHGTLTKICSMAFSDELPVKFEWKDGMMSFDRWDYCTAKDRRFNEEKLEPMEAVGPFKYQSREGPNPPPLGRNIFDLGFGKFNRLGCLTQMLPHMSEVRDFYVDCPDVRSWITENCRHGELHGVQIDPEILAQFARQIIHNNLENDKDVLGKPHRALATTALQQSQPCRRSSSDSSQSAKEVRLRLGSHSSDSNTISSEEQQFINPEPAEKCDKLKLIEQQRLRIESDVCRIN